MIRKYNIDPPYILMSNTAEDELYAAVKHLDAEGMDYLMKEPLICSYKNLCRIEQYLMVRKWGKTHETLLNMKFTLGTAFEALKRFKPNQTLPDPICQAMKEYTKDHTCKVFLLRKACDATDVDYERLVNDWNTFLSVFG